MARPGMAALCLFGFVEAIDYLRISQISLADSAVLSLLPFPANPDKLLVGNLSTVVSVSKSTGVITPILGAAGNEGYRDSVGADAKVHNVVSMIRGPPYVVMGLLFERVIFVDQDNHCLRSLVIAYSRTLGISELGHCTSEGFREDTDPMAVKFSFPSQVYALNSSHALLADRGNAALWLVQYWTGLTPAIITLLSRFGAEVTGVSGYGGSIFVATPTAIWKDGAVYYGNASEVAESTSLYQIHLAAGGSFLIADIITCRLNVLDLIGGGVTSLPLPPSVTDSRCPLTAQPLAVGTDGQIWYVGSQEQGIIVIPAVTPPPPHTTHGSFRINGVGFGCLDHSVYDESVGVDIRFCSFLCVTSSECHGFSYSKISPRCRLHSYSIPSFARSSIPEYNCFDKEPE